MQWSSVGAVLALALLSTAVAYTIYFRLLAATGPTNVVLVTFLVPITALLLGVLVLKEETSAAPTGRTWC